MEELALVGDFIAGLWEVLMGVQVAGVPIGVLFLACGFLPVLVAWGRRVME